jgi:hypothetical protein
MPTDLERQLARFAEALDREAPAISFDDMVGRGTVAVDVDLLERSMSDRAARVKGVPWIDTTPSDDEIGERGVLIDLAPAVVARRPAWRRGALKVALGAAAVAVVVVSLAAIERGGDEPGPADVPPSTVPTPLPKSFTSPDGEVTVSTPEAWDVLWPGEAADEAAPDVWFGMLWRGPEYTFEEGEFLGLVDPVAYDAWCEENGGSPLLSAPASADAIVRELIADPNFETTAPVAASIGGVEAVSIDVALAPGGRTCGIGMIIISRWIHDLEPGAEGVEPFETPGPPRRLRLYLVDLPEGMSVPTLAITVLAPEERFEEFIDETAPIIESIDFHPSR